MKEQNIVHLFRPGMPVTPNGVMRVYCRTIMNGKAAHGLKDVTCKRCFKALEIAKEKIKGNQNGIR